MFTKIRFWIIRKIAGRDIGVAINLSVVDTFHITPEENKSYLICDNVFTQKEGGDE